MRILLVSWIAILLLNKTALTGTGPFGPEKELTSGVQPHCATAADGTLHVVVKSSGIRYMTFSSSGAKSAVELIPGSANAAGSKASSNPWVCVAPDGSVHVVWDTWTEAYYTNRIGGSWKNPVTLPKTADRSYMVQVTGGQGSEVYTAHWSVTPKGPDAYNLFCKVTNTAGSTPKVTELYRASAGARPPSIVGPTAMAAGDGRIHTLHARTQTFHRIMDANGNVSSATDISRTPPKKTGEGVQGFYIGANDLGVVTSWWDGGTVVGPVVNTLSRAQAGKRGIIVGTSFDIPYPRAAYDPVGGKAYILWADTSHRPAVTSWDPAGSALQQLGSVTQGTINGKLRGYGAGGIAARKGGGVHVVYSTGGKIFHRTVDAGSAPPNLPKYGDSNEDGSVGMADLNLLVDWILGRTTEPSAGSTAFTNSDVDGSGTIGMSDLNLLVDYILGRITKFPVG